MKQLCNYSNLIFQIDLPSAGLAIALSPVSSHSFTLAHFLPHEIWATSWVPLLRNFPTFTIDNLAIAIYDAVDALDNLYIV